MTEKIFSGRVIQKHDVEANWLETTNFIPKQGELIVYDADENYSYERFKIGDGESDVNSLPFVVAALSDEEIDAICGINVIPSNERFIDETTGAAYRLYVDNGKLMMRAE